MSSPTTSRPARATWRAILLVHTALVLGLLVLFGVLLALDPPGSGGGANIGLGLVGLPLEGLGLPWSAIGNALFDAFGPDHAFAHDPVLVALSITASIAGAPLNLVLHAILYRWWSRR